MCNDESDLSKSVPIDNHFATQVGRQLTIGLSHDVIVHFKQIGDEVGLSPERVIETYLRHIAHTKYKVMIETPFVPDEPESTVVGNSL
ncbi:MAG: hypothetical protein ABIQ08_01080 [Duganella sp.]